MESWRLMLLASGLLISLGCRGHQYAHVLRTDQEDMVGSHAAGAETFNPLIDEAVAKLLGRCAPTSQPVSFDGAELPVGPQRVCFVCVENKSMEELGDFKEQIYQQIDTQIVQSQHFQPISRRFVDAGLRETRLRPDSLFIPDNMKMFTAAMQQLGQPFDYVLYATLTSGTTENNHSYQRDYLLTLEMVNIHNGSYDKQSAKVRKGYHKTRIGKWRKFNPLKQPGTTGL